MKEVASGLTRLLFFVCPSGRLSAGLCGFYLFSLPGTAAISSGGATTLPVSKSSAVGLSVRVEVATL